MNIGSAVKLLKSGFEKAHPGFLVFFGATSFGELEKHANFWHIIEFKGPYNRVESINLEASNKQTVIDFLEELFEKIDPDVVQEIKGCGLALSTRDNWFWVSGAVGKTIQQFMEGK